jgi:hypothetical protein
MAIGGPTITETPKPIKVKSAPTPPLLTELSPRTSARTKRMSTHSKVVRERTAHVQTNTACSHNSVTYHCICSSQIAGPEERYSCPYYLASVPFYEFGSYSKESSGRKSMTLVMLIVRLALFAFVAVGCAFWLYSSIKKDYPRIRTLPTFQELPRWGQYLGVPAHMSAQATVVLFVAFSGLSICSAFAWGYLVSYLAGE